MLRTGAASQYLSRTHVRLALQKCTPGPSTPCRSTEESFPHASSSTNSRPPVEPPLQSLPPHSAPAKERREGVNGHSQHRSQLHEAALVSTCTMLSADFQAGQDPQSRDQAKEVGGRNFVNVS